MNDTHRDQPRPVATGRDNDFTLSLEEASERYAKAGHARTLRTLQRYCASGHLDAQKIATTTGDKYLVTPQSVDRHIAQIEELNALDAVATSRDVSRHGATSFSEKESPDIGDAPAATGDDKARQAATEAGEPSRYVGLLERDNEFLRDQVQKKDEQITDLSKRFGETQTLLAAMQRMVAPLLGQADPFTTPEKREVNEAATSSDE